MWGYSHGSWGESVFYRKVGVRSHIPGKPANYSSWLNSRTISSVSLVIRISRYEATQCAVSVNTNFHRVITLVVRATHVEIR